MPAVGLVLFLLLCTSDSAFATIRAVPDPYPTIATALQAASTSDTILLQPGRYQESIAITNSLTIASRYILSNDTNDIQATQWLSPDTTFLAMNNASVIVNGLHFRSIRVHRSNQILLANYSSSDFENCRFEGVFDTSNSNRRTFQWNDSLCSGTFNQCVFFGDSIGHTQLIYARGDLTFRQCSFFGRNRASEITYNAIVGRDSTFIDHCTFRFRGGLLEFGKAIHICNSSFIGTGSNALAFVTSTIRHGLVSDCLFDSIDVSDQHPIVYSNVNESPIQFSRCIFSNVSGNSTGYFYGNAWFQFFDCEFNNNSGSTVLFRASNCQIFQSIFRANLTPLFSNRGSNANIYIQNTDFMDNAQFETVPLGETRLDTVNAPNCYWGDPTGPHHVMNLNGLGMNLPDFVNPFPYRTTPVFPESSAQEHRFSSTLPSSPLITLAYPNPFNSSTTIHYSLPHEGEATIVVYDVDGRIVETLAKGYMPVGNGTIRWRPGNISSGAYFFRLQAGRTESTTSALYLK